eukprot:TRINITY_DN633_c0_g1_i1.p1 TRINITY_DN633_c0_g1~~TRINITY_DN633_c0_g1_i1.p1  ORF type:complete len:340 (+),score=58.76 TRINITY_DN633_c0_g1_i1:56-1075(+)
MSQSTANLPLQRLPAAVALVVLSAILIVVSVLRTVLMEYIYKIPGFGFSQFLTSLDLLVYAIIGYLDGSLKGLVSGFGRSAHPKSNLLLAALVMLSHGAGNASLLYLSFPTKVILKSCKLIPAMAIGFSVLGKRYSFWEYMSALLLIAGLIGFTLTDFSTSVKFEPLGFALLSASVGGDALHAILTERTLRNWPDSMADIMIYSHLFAGIGQTIITISIGELLPAMEFCISNPAAFVVILLHAVLGYAVVFVSVTLVQRFSAVVAIMVASTRKFVSMIMSFVVFPKPFSWNYIVFGVWVLVAISLNVLLKKQKSKHLNTMQQQSQKDIAMSVVVDSNPK